MDPRPVAALANISKALECDAMMSFFKYTVGVAQVFFSFFFLHIFFAPFFSFTRTELLSLGVMAVPRWHRNIKAYSQARFSLARRHPTGWCSTISIRHEPICFSLTFLLMINSFLLDFLIVFLCYYSLYNLVK